MRVPRRLAGIGAADLANSAAFDAYIGPSREVTVDHLRGLIRLHDGATPGGLNLFSSQIATVATRTALAAIDTTKTTSVYLKESGREGIFLWMTGDYSAQITADTLQGVYVKATAIAATAGAWVRKYSELLNPNWFGADPKGITDSAPAFQAAMNMGPTEFPVGVFLWASNIVVSDKKASLIGHGFNSIALVTTTAAKVISHVPTAAGHSFEFKNFIMASGVAPVVGQWAIHVDGSSQVTGAVDPNGRNITGDRTVYRGTVDGVHFLSTDSTNYGFYNGLRITSLLNYTVKNSVFVGKTNTFLGEAFAFDGNGICVDIDFHSIWVFYANIGLNLPDYIEGIYARDYKMVNVNYGVRNQWQSGRSVMLQASCGSSQLQFGPGHVNAMIKCIAADHADYIQIKRNLFIISPDAAVATLAAGIHLSYSNLSSLSDNQYHSVLTSGVLTYQTIIYGVENSDIKNNKGTGFGYAVLLDANNLNNTISGNDCFTNDASYPYCVYVIPSAGNSKNKLSKNTSSGTYPYRGAGTENTNYYEPYTYAAPVQVTVTAAAYTDVNISVPDNFAQAEAPQEAVLFGGLGTRIMGQYSKSASTATSLNFRISSVDGTTMSPGAVACFLHAHYRATPQP